MENNSNTYTYGGAVSTYDCSCGREKSKASEITDEKQLLIEQEKKFLDSLNTSDFESYFKHPWSIYKIMNEIQKLHGEDYTKEKSIFNAMDADDFIQYVKERYPGKITFYTYTEIRPRYKEVQG